MSGAGVLDVYKHVSLYKKVNSFPKEFTVQDETAQELRTWTLTTL